MIEWRRRGEATLKKRLLQARRNGDFDDDMNPADFARYLSTIMTGLAIQAANGATKSEMKRIVRIALRFMVVGSSDRDRPRV
jgi:hypothetical protein